jgi:hypothetical protein
MPHHAHPGPAAASLCPTIPEAYLPREGAVLQIDKISSTNSTRLGMVRQ